MASSAPNTAGNAAGRTHAYLGLVLFLIGMAMIAYVFKSANDLFALPGPTVPTIKGTDANAATNAGMALGGSVVGFAQKLMALLVACIAGSVFASWGVNLMFAAWNSTHPHHPTSPTPPTPPNP